MFSRKSATVCAAAAGMSLGVVSAHADTAYNTVFYGDFGLANADGGISTAHLNNSGDIVGTALHFNGSWNDPFAFYYHDGTAGVIPMAPGATTSSAGAINNNGVGVITSDGNGFAYNLHTQALNDIGTLGGTYIGGSTAAGDINDNGYVVGTSIYSDTAYLTHAALFYPPTQDVTDLGALGSDTDSAGFVINNSNQIAGVSSATHASDSRMFFYDGGDMTDVDALVNSALGADATYTSPLDINDSGQVLGYAYFRDDENINNSVFRSVVYDSESGQVETLDTAESPFLATSFNEDGTVVGSRWDGSASHAVVYSPGSGARTDLDTLAELPDGWSLNDARSINDLGQILATGRNEGGVSQAFLLTPITSNTAPIAPAPGDDGSTTVSVNGGSGSPGGVTATFQDASGTFSAQYDTTTADDLASQTTPFDFALPSGDGDVQVWELAFDGTSGGDATRITLFYDDGLLAPGTDESALAVYHFVGGVWQLTDNLLVDTEANSISFDTFGFSPFALGTVPEPATVALLGLGTFTLVGRSARGRGRAKA